MDRSPQFRDGYRNAAKEAVAWLHERATEMNDPQAVAILNSAATNLGWHFERNPASPPLTPSAAKAP